MYKCLVTKLDVSVDDSSLPVFINVSDYSDFISASGNSSMTDEQKYAVAEFFSNIGAKEDDGIFSKLKYIYIPFLCSEVGYSLVNYKDFVRTTPVSGVTLSNHGIVAASALNQEKTFSIPIELNDFSVFAMRTTSMSSGTFDFLAVMEGTTHKVHFNEFIPSNGTNNLQICKGTSSTATYTKTESSTSGAGVKGILKGFSVSTDVIAANLSVSVIATSQSALTDTINSGKFRLFSYSQMSGSIPGGMLLIGSALTMDEVTKLKTFAEKLASAFI